MVEQRRTATSPGPACLRESRRWPPVDRGAPAPEAHDWTAGEPEIPDLLRDPVIHAVLRRDGLTPQDLADAIARARGRLMPATENDAA
jgi:hypothetical protein